MRLSSCGLPGSYIIISAACLVASSLAADGRPERKAGPAPTAAPRPALLDPAGIQQAYAGTGFEFPALVTVLRRRGVGLAGFEVTSGEAVATWERLRALTKRTGYYPLIWRCEHGAEEASEDPDTTTPASVLAEAAAIRMPEWFEQRLEEQRKAAVGHDEKFGLPMKPGDTSEPMTKYTVPYDILTGRAVPGVFIVLIPTRNPWEAPAYVAFGGWNECPADEVHVRALRYWHETYGAEPVGMTHDVLECRALRPPATAEAAMALAKQQYLYCPDIVDQGVGSIDALAWALRKAGIWYFWWD